MGIIILESDDDLGYIIKKNPSSDMIKRQTRNCEMSGFYKLGSKSSYMVYGRDFRDCSFKTSSISDNNYLNPNIYSSATFVIAAISDFFDAPLKQIQSTDKKCVNKLTINAFPFDKNIKMLQTFAQYLNVTTDIVKHNGSNKIIIEVNDTIHYLLNAVIIMMTLLASHNNEDLQIKDSFSEKIISSIVRCDAPYFVRYYMSSRILNRDDFHKFKKVLEKSQKYHNMILNFGYTAGHRRSFIEKNLSFKNSIVDIGCGEGFYLIPFSKKIHDKTYIGMDIELDVLEKLKQKITDQEIKNVHIFDDIDNVISQCNQTNEKYDIIVTEVIEHMDLNLVPTFLQKIIDNINFNKIIITTPNHDFNQFYKMDTEYRHHDHKWEIGKNEFIELIHKLKLNEQYKTKFLHIGDVVNDISCTIGFEIVN